MRPSALRSLPLPWGAIAALALAGCGRPTASTLLINEVAAGDDFVELLNPTGGPLSLAGYSLADATHDPAPLSPGTVVGAGELLVLRGDDLPFGLSRDGDRVELRSAGRVVDACAWAELLPEFALARLRGSDGWTVSAPSPGLANPRGRPPRGRSRSRCQPADRDATSLLPGQPWVVGLTCGRGSLADFAVVPHGTPGRWDPTAGTFTATDLGPGRHAVLFEVRGAGGVPELERAVVDVVADRLPDAPVDPTTYVAEHGLPVLHLAPGAPLTTAYVPARAWLDGREYSATMKIRGRTSADHAKNHYTLEFEPRQLDLREHGLGRKDHLVLLSNFDDAAVVRQWLAYDTWAAMRADREGPSLTPRAGWVVVYRDGRYLGLYLALDHVDDEFVGEMGLPRGGGLWKSISRDADFRLRNDRGARKGPTAGWLDKSRVPNPRPLAELTNRVAGASPQEFAQEAPTWLDLDEIIDWSIFVEHLAAGDNVTKNAYLYRDPDSGRFRYAPWDLNHSLGQNWRTRRIAARWSGEALRRNGLFARILDDPNLAERRRQRWQVLMEPGGALHGDRLQEQVHAAWDRIDAAARRDWQAWGEAHRTERSWSLLRGGPDAIGGPDDERAYLLRWIRERDAFLRERLDAP